MTTQPTKPKTKVLFLDTNDGVGGVVRVHLSLLEGFDRDRFDVTLACLGRGGVFPLFQEIPEIELLPLEVGTKPSEQCSGLRAALANIASLLPFGGAVCRLARYCRSEGVDVIYSSDKKRALALACMLTRTTHLPFICHAHARFADSRLTRCAVSRAAAVVANSKYTKQSFVDAVGASMDRIHIVPNGVDADQFSPRASSLRERLGLGEDRVLIGNVGRLAPDKCQAEFLRAAAIVAKQRPEAFFLLVGDDSIYDDNQDYGQVLRNLVSELGLADSVRFLGFQPDMPDVYNGLDIMVDSCWCEGFGMVVVEAMACGKVVVGTDGGGIPDIITHGEDGLLFPPRDVEGMASVLCAAAADPGKRQRIGEQARETVMRRFTAEVQTRAIEDLLCQAAETSG